MKQAIILAAGKGSRLSKYTHNVPKTLLPIKYGQTILERMLTQLISNGVTKVIIVLGYQYKNAFSIIKELSASYTEVSINIVENCNYDTTGTLKSLLVGIDSLPYPNEDFIIIEGDVVCDHEVINNLVKESGNILVGDSRSRLEDESMRYNLKDNKIIHKINKDLDFNISSGEAIGVLRIDSISKNKFYNYSKEIFNNNNYAFYEEVIDQTDIQFELLDIYPNRWTEVDFPGDYKKARQIFTDIKKIDIDFSLFEQSTHSPSIFSLSSDMDVDMQDFCYLANPYLVSDELVDEISIELKQLINSYPPFQKELANKLSKYHNGDVRSENIIVGNGATELINIINYWSTGSIVPIPTFSEYTDSANNLLTYQLNNTEDYNLDVEDFITFCNDQSPDNYSNIIIINPNNPVGEMLHKLDVIRLIEKLNRFNIIVDESFLDFSDNSQSVLDLITHYNNLIVVKSFGKTLGIPGIRLGAIYSNAKFIEKIKNKVPFWNVNSIASFIISKMGEENFKKELDESIQQVSNDTFHLCQALTKVPGIKVYQPTGNYVLIKILNNMNSIELRNELLKERIFVRDCSNKIGFKTKKYVRIASRTRKENLAISRHIDMLLADYDSDR